MLIDAAFFMRRKNTAPRSAMERIGAKELFHNILQTKKAAGQSPLILLPPFTGEDGAQS